jgi:ABC-2 type transport system permease protein
MSQAKSLLPDNGRALFGGALAWARSGLFDPGAPLAWPTRAVMGDPLALLVFTTLSVGVFLGVTAALGRRFAADASLAAGAGADRTRRSSAPVTVAGFRDGVFIAMMRKEIRLLVRDPTLLSQVLLRTLYILPMTFVLARNAGRSSEGAHGLMGSFTLAAGAGAVSFMAGQVAGSLAWIAISAEDAPELIACAPVLAAVVRRAKLTAVMIPVAALLAMPLGALLVFSPWIGVCALAGSAASAISSGLINLWFEKPAPRKAFRSRRGGSVLGASAELLIGLGWGVAAAMAAFASPWALIPTAVTLAALAALYGLSAPDRAY